MDEAELKKKIAEGGVVDLDGATVALSAPIAISDGKSLSLSNATIKATGMDYALQVSGPGSAITLDNVHLQGAGLLTCSGAKATLSKCHVSDTPDCGIRAADKSTTLRMTDCSVTGAKSGAGIFVTDGAEANLAGTAVEACAPHCLMASYGAVVRVEGGCARGAAMMAVVARDSGKIYLNGATEVASAGHSALAAFHDGSLIDADGCILSGDKLHGVVAESGSKVVMQKCSVQSPGRSGALAIGKGSVVDAKGTEITGAGDHGVAAWDGGSLTLTDIKVHGCGGCGVLLSGEDVTLKAAGLELSGAVGHGIGVQQGAMAVASKVSVEGCKGSGVSVTDTRSHAQITTVSVTGCEGTAGLACGGGVLSATDVTISDCKGAGIAAAEAAQVNLERITIFGACAHGVACYSGAQVTVARLSATQATESGLVATGEGTLLKLNSVSPPSEVQSARHGVVCLAGARVVLAGVAIRDCSEGGVRVSGKGSSFAMTGGSVKRSGPSHGVHCDDGGETSLEGAEVSENQGCGVAVSGEGSEVRVNKGKISLVRDLHGVAAWGGGSAQVTSVQVLECQHSAVAVSGPGSSVSVLSCKLEGARRGHGLLVESGGRGVLRETAIARPHRCGVAVSGAGSAVVIEGGSITEPQRGDAVRCEAGGKVSMSPALKLTVSNVPHGHALYCDGGQIEEPADMMAVSKCAQMHRRGLPIDTPWKLFGQTHGSGEIDLAGGTITCRSQYFSVAEGHQLVIKNGTLEAADGSSCGSGYLAQVQGHGSSLTLENVTLIKTGAVCGNGGQLILRSCHIREAPYDTVQVRGVNSLAEWTDGTSTKSTRGVRAYEGGSLSLKGVSITECSSLAMRVEKSSSLEADGGSIDGVKSSSDAAVSCVGENARVRLSGMAISNVKSHAVHVYGSGAEGQVADCQITSAMYGIRAESGGRTVVRDTKVAKCETGMFAYSSYSTVEALRCTVDESAKNGVTSEGSDVKVILRDCKIFNSTACAAACNSGSLELSGCTISKAQKGVVAASGSSMVLVRNTEVSDCTTMGLDRVSGCLTECEVTVTACKEDRKGTTEMPAPPAATEEHDEPQEEG